MRVVVAIDGPAGAGKSTVSRELARRLGFAHVDTGAMYRAVAVLARERGIPEDDEHGLAALCDGMTFTFAEGGARLLVDGRDLTAIIREPEIGELASRVSVQSAVRDRLVAAQRRLAATGGVVMEGRDIGTVVVPDAALKIFLTATPAERARRRAAELRGRGQAVDEAVLAAELAARDTRDSSRATAPLRPAADAIMVDTTGSDVAAVVARLEALARAAGLGAASGSPLSS